MKHPSNQPPLLNLPNYKGVEYNFFHDESGNYVPDGGDRFLVHGVLITKAKRQTEVIAELQRLRKKSQFYEEVHFVKLRKSSKGRKATCAKKWINAALSNLASVNYYYILAVDTHSPKFDHSRFSNPYHAYNFYAKMTMVSAISWVLNNHEAISIRLHSDKKHRPKEDNFTTYLPKEVQKSINSKWETNPKKYPYVNLLANEVILVESDPKKCPPESLEECELIQLVDLLASNVNQVISASSTQAAKIELGQQLSAWIDDISKLPWKQNKDLHRRFNVVVHPGKDSLYYSPRLKILEIDQPKLPLKLDN